MAAKLKSLDQGAVIAQGEDGEEKRDLSVKFELEASLVKQALFTLLSLCDAGGMRLGNLNSELKATVWQVATLVMKSNH